jgi:MATE family multidrug resistance protein
MSIAASGAPAAGNRWITEARAMLALAWPMVLTNLGQTAMTTTDVMMMGRLGADQLAAGTLGSSLYFGPMIFGLGLISACSPMIAAEVGRKGHSVRDVRRTVRQAMWIALAVVVPLWVLLWHAEPILLLLGQEPHLAAIAGSYVRALQWAALPFYWYVVLRSFMSALERPGWALGIVAFAVAFNAGANWCLMYGNLGLPALGVAGSGIATTLSSVLMFIGLAAIVSIERRFRRYHLFGRFWRADWPRFRALLRLGLPIGGILIFEVSIFNAAAFLMGLIDAVSLAAHAIALQIASVAFMVPMGLGQAVTVRVGRAFGARSIDGIALSGWTALVMGVGFMTLTALAMLTLPRLFIGAFIDVDAPENAQVVATAILFLSFAALFQVFDGAQAVASGMLRGIHDTTVPMVFAAIGYWGVGLPLGIALAFGLGVKGAGIWIGLSSGLAVVAVLLIARWLRRERILARVWQGA